MKIFTAIEFLRNVGGCVTCTEEREALATDCEADW